MTVSFSFSFLCLVVLLVVHLHLVSSQTPLPGISVSLFLDSDCATGINTSPLLQNPSYPSPASYAWYPQLTSTQWGNGNTVRCVSGISFLSQYRLHSVKIECGFDSAFPGFYVLSAREWYWTNDCAINTTGSYNVSYTHYSYTGGSCQAGAQFYVGQPSPVWTNAYGRFVCGGVAFSLSSSSGAGTGNSGSTSTSISGGAIAGIVIGSIVGAALCAAFFIYFLCFRTGSDWGWGNMWKKHDDQTSEEGGNKGLSTGSGDSAAVELPHPEVTTDTNSVQ